MFFEDGYDVFVSCYPSVSGYSSCHPEVLQPSLSRIDKVSGRLNKRENIKMCLFSLFFSYTTEFSFFQPGKQFNNHNTDNTMEKA